MDGRAYFGIGLCAYVVLCIYLGSYYCGVCAAALFAFCTIFDFWLNRGDYCADIGAELEAKRKQWISVAVFGVCQNALYLGLNFVAMQTVEASLAAIIASTMPLIVACAGWIIFRERLSTLGICGLISGLIGVAVIRGSRIQADVDLFGIVLCVVGAASLAAATLSMRGVSSSGNFLVIVGLQMLVGSLTLWVPAMMLETPTIVWTNAFVYAFIYTTLVPGLLATLVWFILVDRIGAVRASTYHFLNPFLGSRLRRRYS